MFNFNLVYPSQALCNLWQEIPRTIKVTFISTFIIGMLVHCYSFINILLLSGDGMGIGAFSVSCDLPCTLTSGRWFQSFAFFLTGSTSTYWIRGVVSLLYITTAASIIVNCLEIKNIYSCILIGAALVTFPSTAAIFAYLHVADTVYLSFLLACLAALLCKKFNYGFIFGGVVLAFSLGIYQAYISFTAGLLMISLTHEVLNKNNDIEDAFVKSAKYLVCLILGLLLYYIILEIRLHIKNVSLSSYQGIDQTGTVVFSQLHKLIKKAYSAFFYFFYNHQFLFVRLSLSKIIFTTILASIPITVALIWSSNSSIQQDKKPSKRDKINGLLLVALTLTFPLAVNLVYLFGTSVSVHMLMVYSLSLTYVFAISLMDRLDLSVFNTQSGFKKSIATFVCWALLAIFIIVPYNYFVVINNFYFKGNVVMRHACQFSSSLLKDIKAFPGYQNGMQIVLFGTRSYSSDSVMNMFKQDCLHTDIIDKNSVINSWNYNAFLRSAMGEDLNIFYPYTFSPNTNAHWDYNVLFDSRKFISDDHFFDPYREELMKLEIYPSQKSMKVIDNKLFIRMGNPKNPHF